MAEIRTDFIIMMDGLVQESFRPMCREASGLDFSTIVPGQWVPHEAFNKYMKALKERGGAQGARIVGTKIVLKLQELFKSLDVVPSLDKAHNFLAKSYSDSNRGQDVGYFELSEVGEHEATVITTSALDPDFHIGVFEGCARHFKKWVAKSEIVETLEKNGRYVFKYRY